MYFRVFIYLIFSKAKNKENNYSKSKNCVIVHTIIYNFGALAKSITGYHKNMVRKQCPVLELANQMPVRNMDLARAPRGTARKKGSGYENASIPFNEYS